MTTELAVRENREATLMMPVLRPDQAVERYALMKSYVAEVLDEGRDFGAIPGTDKRTLLKPGAEKLLTIFGLTKRFEEVRIIEDWTGEEHGGEPFFYYLYRAKAYRGDVLIAEADGSCNSWETKYRYRTANRVCPQCGAEAIIKGKEKFGGGWLCWKKRDGCGAKFNDGDTAIEGQEVGRIPNPDPADVANTILKMAQKRALVAVTLLAVNASDYFTQDVEDFDEADTRVPSAPPTSTPTPAPTPAPAPSTANGSATDSDADGFVIDEQRALMQKAADAGALAELWNSWPKELQTLLKMEFGDRMAEVRGDNGSKPKPAPRRQAAKKPAVREVREPAEVLVALQSVEESGTLASGKQAGLLAGKLEECWAGDDNAKLNRYLLLEKVYGVKSATKLDKAQASSLLDLILVPDGDGSGDFSLDHIGAEEIRQLLTYLETEEEAA